MLSYQHAYHAGGPADVHKHAALAVLLARLVEAVPRLSYFETHAGRGLYDLASPEAEKTGEAALGIRRLELEPVLGAGHPYAQVLRAVRRIYGPDFYPGSPLVARALLRDEDRLTLCELHPQEFAALKANLPDAAIAIRKADGFQTVLTMCPPETREGLVFVDPSYEIRGEYMAVADFLISLHRRWSRGVMLLWYPLLEAAPHVEMLRRLKVAGLPGFWHQEVGFAPQARKRALGSGLVGVNLPEGAAEALAGIADLFDPLPAG